MWASETTPQYPESWIDNSWRSAHISSSKNNRLYNNLKVNILVCNPIPRVSLKFPLYARYDLRLFAKKVAMLQRFYFAWAGVIKVP